MNEVDRERYARHLLLPGVGLAGQRALAEARILVVGAGGLGSPALLYLAAAGVGTIGIVDDDVVEASNLQRQVVHADADGGRWKVDSAADAVCRLNPSVTVHRHRLRLTEDNADQLLAAYQVVLDGSDNFETRYVVGAACARAGIPHVWASVLRFDAQVSVWWAGHGPCYRCVFPDPPQPGQVPSCAEAGVLGALCGAVGSVQAAEALKLVLGIGEPLVGRLLVHDALAQSWDTIPVRAQPDCPVCASAPAARPRTGAIRPAPVAQTSPVELAAALAAPSPPVLIDVRTMPERRAGAIAGSIGMPLAELIAGRPIPAGQDANVVFYCASGIRSEQAIRLALEAGGSRFAHLAGGIEAWSRAGLPVYSDPDRPAADGAAG